MHLNSVLDTTTRICNDLVNFINGFCVMESSFDCNKLQHVWWSRPLTVTNYSMDGCVCVPVVVVAFRSEERKLFFSSSLVSLYIFYDLNDV